MFRQLKVPILGMIENMAFFDMAAYLAERGGARARDLIRDGGLFDQPGDERVYLFGRGGAKRKAEEMGVPFLGEVPLNIVLRESGDAGKLDESLREGSPARSSLLGVVEQLAAQISIQNIKTPKMPKLEILS
jgi:ATP-binding protein involved in chromosome partitioning